MKPNSIELIGASTHNLKNINITINKNSVTSIYGRSGAGKSSLAFSTLYKVCRDEFDALENGYTESQDYEVKDYKSIIPAVAISQSNKNNNPRSTLYSYLNIPQILSSLITEYRNKIPEYKYLKINKPDNECQECSGRGEIPSIELNDIIDKNKSISEKPFSIWEKGTFSNLYQNLLLAYSNTENIDINIPFKDLSQNEKNKLLYGNSKERLSVSFKYRGASRKRKIFYEGLVPFAEKSINKTSVKTMIECPTCLGAKINVDLYKDISIFDINFLDFVKVPVSTLIEKLSFLDNNNELIRVLYSISNLGLGYLNLSRTIPSLSGGELQKLRFSRLLNSNISGVLVVIDEISSQINHKDFEGIFQKIKQLSKNNTIVLIEHSDYFISRSDNIIHIGPKPGKLGGYICPEEKILPIKFSIVKNTPKDFLHFNEITRHNVINQNISIPKKCLTVLAGVSGSGKTTIAREIEKREETLYVSQKASSFNSRSVLASSLNLNKVIASYFSKHTNIDLKYFLLSKEAGCKTCGGIGVVKYTRGYDKDIYITCPTCEGLLFDKTSEYIYLQVNGLTIIDFYSKEVNELSTSLKKLKNTLTRTLQTMVGLGLGYLSLNRKTQTLSGGEINRVKLCDHLSRMKVANKILIIDEPVSGLDAETASIVAKFIHSKVHLFSAIIIIEHRLEVVEYADYMVTIGPGAGILGGEIQSQRRMSS